MSHEQLDARRLMCPLPVIRTQNRAKTLASGDTLEIICTDPGARQDIPAWCRVHGHRVLGIEERDKEIFITIEIS